MPEKTSGAYGQGQAVSKAESSQLASEPEHLLDTGQSGCELEGTDLQTVAGRWKSRALEIPCCRGQPRTFFRGPGSPEAEAHLGAVLGLKAEPQWCVDSGGHASPSRRRRFEDGWAQQELGMPRTSKTVRTGNVNRNGRGNGSVRGLRSVGCLRPVPVAAGTFWTA